MQLQNKIVLTGVKPTGILHIGNYYGALKPAIEMGRDGLAQGGKHVMFIANYHSVNYLKNPEEMQECTERIACAYLACGMDPEKTIFYCQSDVPEVFEMTTLLTNFTPKGFMNKAHAYKAAVDKNVAKGEPQDAGINMGLYNYPILMAADILTYGSDYVPVGKDQVQHVEITADIAGAVNACYDKQIFKIPQAITVADAASIPGTDGRKMSKSYGNVIPLIASADEIRKAVMGIKTDCQDINARKNPDEILLYQIACGVCPPDVVSEIKEGLTQGGMGYGTIKKMMAESIVKELAPIYDAYQGYKANYSKVEEMLQEGAKRARALAQPVLETFKATVLNKKSTKGK